MDALRELDAGIRARHLLKHPFYRAWSNGELSMKTLRSYAGQYYHFEREFPQFVGGVYAQLPDAASRRALLQNLNDEEGRDPTHPELWLRFAAGIGADRNAVERGRPRPATNGLLRVYRDAAIGGPVDAGLGALYAYESIFPEVAAEKSRGLREQFGIRDRATHEFFRVHTFADKEHSAAEREVLARRLREHPGAARSMLSGARRSTEAWWNFLSSFPAC